MPRYAGHFFMPSGLVETFGRLVENIINSVVKAIALQ